MSRLRISLSLLLLALVLLVPLGVAMHTHDRGGQLACAICALAHLTQIGDLAPAPLVASLLAATLVPVFERRSVCLRPASAPLVRGPPITLL